MSNFQRWYPPLPDALGIGLIDQNQTITLAVMQMADMNVCAHLS